MDVASFADQWLPEEPALVAARKRAADVGATPVSPAVGAALRFLAAALGARSVVETGTSTGVSTLWLVRGVRPDGVVTSIEADAEHARLARTTLAEAEVPHGRSRLINGSALEVLPRLSDESYDLVHLDAPPAELADQLAEALRLLRPGGILAISGALLGGRVADSAVRDPETSAVRSLGESLREHPGLVACLLPVGDGLLAAVRVSDRG